LAGKYKLEPEAKEDLKDAVLWYENQQTGVGEEFFQNVYERIEFIAEKPESYSTFYKEFRKTPVKKFPYYIFYIVKKAFVSIVAILHTKRSSETIQKRIDKLEE
jgi:plasmid stabilization system protein ParE